MTITNIYLSEREYAVLAQLPALELRKIGHNVEHDHRISVDAFEAYLTGLVLAEVGFDTPEEMERPPELPQWLGREISSDIRFTGGASPASRQTKPPI